MSFVILQTEMGLKRAFDDEEGLQELSFKHPKQLDSNNSYGAPQKATSLADINSSFGAFQKIDIPGKLKF